MKNPLDDYYVFCQIVKFGSMKLASERLQLPLSSMSRRVSSLEDHLGVKLFVRGKNKLTVTDKGALFYEKLIAHTESLSEAINKLHKELDEVIGRVVISTPKFFYDHLLDDTICELVKLHPKLEIEVKIATEAAITEVDDLVIAAGELPDSALIARKLINTRPHFYCSQTFMEQHKETITQYSFNSLPFVTTYNHPPASVRRNTNSESFAPKKCLTVTGLDSLVNAVSKGVGFAILPDYILPLLADDVRQNLVQIFEEIQLNSIPIHLLYRERKLQTTAQSLLIDAISRTLNEHQLTP